MFGTDAAIRISGVEVGQLSAIDLGEDNRIVVTLRIREQLHPLYGEHYYRPGIAAVHETRAQHQVANGDNAAVIASRRRLVLVVMDLRWSPHSARVAATCRTERNIGRKEKGSSLSALAGMVVGR